MADVELRCSPDAQRPPFALRRRARSPLDWSFEQLLDPVSLDTFARDYWGRHPLVVRGDPAFFTSLITLDDVETLLGIPHILQDQMVSLRAKGDEVSLAPEGVGHIYRRLQEGASLQFRKMERFLPPDAPLARLYRDMQLELQHPGVSISAFVTPPDAELLGAHHDETEIFTLQISGRKRWRFFPQAVAEGRGPYHGVLDPPIEDVVLGPGDLLYHPRGQVHEVTCEDELSFSIPIVFGPLTWKELLHQLVDRLAGRPEFMEALPAGSLFGEDAGDRLAGGVAARAALIAAEAMRLDPDELASAGALQLLEGLGAARGRHLAGALTASTITPQTRILPLHGGAYRVSVRDDRAVLMLGGGDGLTMPVAVAPALRAVMARRAPVAAGALHDSLSASASLVLARRLLSLGALTSAEPDGPQAD